MVPRGRQCPVVLWGARRVSASIPEAQPVLLSCDSLDASGTMLDPNAARCAGCAKLMALAQLTYDDDGRLLCAKCHAVKMSDLTGKVVLSADEYRACEVCAQKLVPQLVRDGSSNFDTRRRYACHCGHAFWTLTWPALLMATVFGAMGALGAGHAFHDQDLDEMIVPAILMAIACLFLVRDATIRHRNPRVL